MQARLAGASSSFAKHQIICIASTAVDAFLIAVCLTASIPTVHNLSASSTNMIFYIVMGGLFALYGLDLLMLVAVSALARAQEVADLLKERRRVHKQYKRNAGKEKKNASKGACPDHASKPSDQPSSKADACTAGTNNQQLPPGLPDLKLAATIKRGERPDVSLHTDLGE